MSSVKRCDGCGRLDVPMSDWWEDGKGSPPTVIPGIALIPDIKHVKGSLPDLCKVCLDELFAYLGAFKFTPHNAPKPNPERTFLGDPLGCSMVGVGHEFWDHCDRCGIGAREWYDTEHHG